MGFFKKEVIIAKESNSAREQLAKLEALLPRATGETAQRMQKDIALLKAGIAGEENILFELKNSGMDLVVLQDIYLECEGLSAQIDYYVITPKMNIIIECKNLYGDIEINNNGDFIRTFEVNGRKVKEGIYSPITQNERHLEVLKACNLADAGMVQKAVVQKLFFSYNKSLVVLANPKTVVNDRYAKKEVKEKVLRADQLIATLKKMEGESKAPSDNMKQMQERANWVLQLHQENRKDYTEKYEALLQAVEATEQQPVNTMLCPLCGGKLVKHIARTGRYQGNEFLGCSNYPKCRYLKNL